MAAHVVLRTHVDHSLQAMIMLQILCLRSRDARVVIGQPDDRRRRDQLWCEEDPRHLFRMASERQLRQARRRIRVRACCALRGREIVQRLSH